MAVLEEMGRRARSSARQLARLSGTSRSQALVFMADALNSHASDLHQANQQDIEAAEQQRLSPALIDRLTLTQPRLQALAADLRQVASLPDPVGEVFEAETLANGLAIHKQRVPIGVLAVIYESRPNVTLDVAGLSVKTGNAVILRGGRETLHTNRSLVRIIRESLEAAGLPRDSVQFIDDPDRSLVQELLRLDAYVDMVIPRGGSTLHAFCRQNSTIPVITGGIGVCHLFVDRSANLDRALEVVRNAKIQRPTVCNALDTVLVHTQVAEAFVPRMLALLAADGVSFRVDPGAATILSKDGQLPQGVLPAGPEDFDTEWLSLILGIRIVKSVEEAMEHIAAHSTGHSDGILTEDLQSAERFVAQVDSAAVYVNASTRFTDGGQFGLGAEVAISTQRLHARGPMGLRELTTYKWVVRGDYSLRQ
jgi:glutamate-5-semialdehyde dehydrogenase